MTFLAAFGLIALGMMLGVQFGRWSLLLLWRASWRAQYLRQLRRRVPVPPARVPHAGYLVQPRSRAGWGSVEPPGQFRMR